jgi:cytochrome c553
LAVFTLPLAAQVNGPDEARAQQIVAGRCHRCHGPTGLSTTDQFPKLAGQNVEYLTKQMFNFQSRIRWSVVMEEQMSGLSGNDIEALARYFSQQRITPDAVSDPKLAERGRRLFFEGNPKTGVAACVSCHGPQARGAQMLPRLAGQHASYLARQLRAFMERARTNDRAKMHIVARNLTADEIRAVSYFLSGLE